MKSYTLYKSGNNVNNTFGKVYATCITKAIKETLTFLKERDDIDYSVEKCDKSMARFRSPDNTNIMSDYLIIQN